MKWSILFFAILSVQMVSNAVAEPVNSFRDWYFSTKNTNCYAFTEGTRDSQEYQFGVVLTKDSGRPVEWYIIRTGRGAKVTSLQGGTSVDSSLMQFGLQSSGNSELFFFLGNRSFKGIVDGLTSVNEIKFASLGGETKPVKFSTRGLKEAIAHLEKRCNQGASVQKGEFDTLFLQGVPSVVNLAQIDPTRVTSIRALLSRAYDLFLSGQATRKELADLRARYGSELTRAEQLDQEINDLKTVGIPRTQKEISDTEQLIVKSRAELVTVKSKIPGLEAAVVPLQQDYDAKKAILDTVAPGHNELQNELDSREESLDSAEKSLSRASSRLSENRWEQSRLSQRVSSLTSELEALQRERTNAQSRLRAAESELVRFDLRWEISERLRRNSSYERYKREAEDLERELQIARQSQRRAREQRDQASDRLRQCQAIPESDCSLQQNELNEANRQVASADQQVRSLDFRLSNARNEVGQIEREAERDARQIQSRLIAGRDRAQSQFDEIEGTILSKRTERDRISGIELPNLRQEENNLESRIQQLQSALPGLRSAVASARSALAAYDARVGYAAKRAAADGALSRLNVAKGALNDAMERREELEMTIASAGERLAEAKVQLEQLRGRLAQSQKALEGLRPILEKYRTEKAPIEAKLAEVDAQFSGTRGEYVKTLPDEQR